MLDHGHYRNDARTAVKGESVGRAVFEPLGDLSNSPLRWLYGVTKGEGHSCLLCTYPVKNLPSTSQALNRADQ